MKNRQLQYTIHARDMLAERKIPESWVERTVFEPDSSEEGDEGTTHYIRAIPEHEGRILRVVLNTKDDVWTVVTLFFDRRLRRKE